MKTVSELYETVLTPAAVDECSGRLRSFLSGCGIPQRECTRYALTAEEILLKTQDPGDGQPVTLRLKTGRKLGRPFFSLELPGPARNVFVPDSQNRGVLGDNILKNLGLSPDYSYAGGVNVYAFRIRRERKNPFSSLLIALAAALLVGFGGLLLPDALRALVLDCFLTPLYDTFFNVLGCIAGPMIYLSVAWGIYGIGDAATLKSVGKQLISGYVGTVAVLTTALALALLPLFDLHFSGGPGGTSGLLAVFSMLLGVIPENIFAPFINGNTLQIIFLAIVTGITMLFLDQKTTAVAKAVEQINYMVQFLIEFISRLIPAFIFIVLLDMIWSDTVSVLMETWKLFVLFVAGAAVLAAVLTCYTAAVSRVSPLLLLKKGLPTFLIAVTTASSAAAFGTNMRACRSRYGIHDTVASFGVPLGIVAFKPTTALDYVITSLFFAELYGVSVSAAWVIVLIFTAVILSVATPPIPGGAMTAFTVLFLQLGIPTEALAMALACDALFDFVCTGFDQYTLPLALLNQARKLGMVDGDVLRSDG